MAVKLNFINQSKLDNPFVVIFQKNIASTFYSESIAWMVIQNCGRGDNHPFSFEQDLTISASDSYGNCMPQLPAKSGQQFCVSRTSNGDTLSYDDREPTTNERELVLRNDLSSGAINALVYRSNRLLAQRTSVVPGQTAEFEFNPTIWIGVAEFIVQGQLMTSSTSEAIDTEISLLGVASADIVLTGGGDEGAPQFSLQNVVMA
jgi:hypothetical protein